VFAVSKKLVPSLKVYEKGVLTPLLSTRKSTAIRGLLATVHSVEMMMEEIVFSENSDLK